jgi:predicted nucleotidyltransferase
MSVAELPIQIDLEKIAQFCRARGIRKLSLFGSVLRDDFDPARSDVDVLASSIRTRWKGLVFVISVTAKNWARLSVARWIFVRVSANTLKRLCAGRPFQFMSAHDPKATLLQIQEAARRLRMICADTRLARRKTVVPKRRRGIKGAPTPSLARQHGKASP